MTIPTYHPSDTAVQVLGPFLECPVCRIPLQPHPERNSPSGRCFQHPTCPIQFQLGPTTSRDECIWLSTPGFEIIFNLNQKITTVYQGNRNDPQSWKGSSCQPFTKENMVLNINLLVRIDSSVEQIRQTIRTLIMLS